MHANPNRVRFSSPVGVLLTLCALSPVLAHSAPDLDGTWVLYRAEDFGDYNLTSTGQKFRSSYDFGKDDPALQCIPASWTRVYSNPNTPFSIRLTDDNFELKHELFDIVRNVPVVASVLHK